MNIKKTQMLGVIGCFGLMMACTPTLKSELGAASAAAENNSDLQDLIAASVGVYDLPCWEGTRDTHIFKSNGEIVSVARDFAEEDTDCSGEPLMFGITTARFVEAEKNDIAEGSYDVTIEQGPAILVVRHEDMVSQINSYLGQNLVELGVPFLVSGLVGQAEIGDLNYQIYRFVESEDGKVYQFGVYWEDEDHDGTSPEKRPIAYPEIEVAENTEIEYLQNYAGIAEAMFSGQNCINLGDGSLSVLNLIGSEESVQAQIYYLDDSCETPAGYIVREFSIAESSLGDIDEGLDRFDLTGKTHYIHPVSAEMRTSWVSQCAELDALLVTGESYSADGVCGGDPANVNVFTSGYVADTGYYLASGEEENAPSGDSAEERLNANLESIYFAPYWQ